MYVYIYNIIYIYIQYYIYRYIHNNLYAMNAFPCTAHAFLFRSEILHYRFVITRRH